MAASAPTAREPVAAPAALLAGLLLASTVLVGGCASAPRAARDVDPAGAARGAPVRAPAGRDIPGRDFPGSVAPADLQAIADPEPQVEPVRPGGPNRPYEALGRAYAPLPADAPLAERGLASWYGGKFHGRRTASGETYDMYAMTAAHPTLPIPSYARVTNPANGRVVIVRVNDRGPFVAGRIVDLSYAAAAKLGVLRATAPVELERITWAEIRSGSWRRGAAAAARPAGPTAAAPAPATPAGADPR